MNDAGWLIEPFSLFESSIVVFPTTQARQLFHTWMSCEKLNKNLFCHMTMLWPQMKFESSFLGVLLVFTEPLSLINFIWFLSFCFVTSHRMCGLVVSLCWKCNRWKRFRKRWKVISYSCPMMWNNNPLWWMDFQEWETDKHIFLSWCHFVISFCPGKYSKFSLIFLMINSVEH